MSTQQKTRTVVLTPTTKQEQGAAVLLKAVADNLNQLTKVIAAQKNQVISANLNTKTTQEGLKAIYNKLEQLEKREVSITQLVKHEIRELEQNINDNVDANQQVVVMEITEALDVVNTYLRDQAIADRDLILKEIKQVKGLQNPELNQSLIRNHKEIIELLNKTLEATKNIKEVNLPEDKQDLILEAVKTIHIPETKLPEDKQVEILEAVESLKAHIVKEAKEPEVPILEGYSGGIMAALGAICLTVGLLFGAFKSKIFLLFTSIFSKIKGKIKK